MSTRMKPAQLALPRIAVTPRYEDAFPLELLPPDEYLPSGPVDRAFVASIEIVHRVLEPIIVLAEPEAPGRAAWRRHAVPAGKRRTKGARAAGLAHIPALIFPLGSLNPSQVTLIENRHRSANPFADTMAVADWSDSGADDDTIMRGAAMTKTDLAARRRLAGLHPALLDAGRQGKITGSVAEAAAKLAPDRQERLVAALAEKGKLTAADVRGASQADQEAAILSLPAGLFDTPDAQAASSWREAVVALLLQALQIVPPDEGSGRAALRACLDAISGPAS